MAFRDSKHSRRPRGCPAFFNMSRWWLACCNSRLSRRFSSSSCKGERWPGPVAGNPYLKVRASTTKNNKAATIWLNEEVAAELKKLVLPGAT